MIASFGMYDRPQTQAVNDRLWALVRDNLRAAGIEAPQELTRGEGAYWPAWTSDRLLLSQTCGFPYRARLHDKVQLVATPDFGLPLCPPGHYNSVLVVRADDARRADKALGAAPPEMAFAGSRFAFNEDLSQSGWAAPQNHAAALGFHFRPALRTGSHAASALAVAEGRADIAAIDAQTWRLLSAHEPFTTALAEIGRTLPATPALPYITSRGQDAQKIAAALGQAIEDLAPDDRAALGLRGLCQIPAQEYLAVPTPPSPADLGMAGD